MLQDAKRSLAVLPLSQTHAIKALYVTSAMAVTLAGILFAVTAFAGVPTDDNVERILCSPGVRERFEGTREKSADNQTSPLLREVEAFAHYLAQNEETPEISAERTVGDASAQMPFVTPKFKVFATSCFEANPQLSLALIDEPGRGKHWVRQSSFVGRFFIEKIMNGRVVVKCGKEAVEVLLEKRAETSPTSRPSFVSTGVIDRAATKTSRI